MTSHDPALPRVHTISVVIPVYKGEVSLPALVAELEAYTAVHPTPGGHRFVIESVVLVWDNGPDRSDLTIRALSERYPFVRPVWLSRNFGQHAATMAGMSATESDWIVTMDEDGAHDPANIGLLLDTALAEAATVVYAKPPAGDNRSPVRNWTSRTAKRILAALTANRASEDFNSFRLILGETGRTLASGAGQGAYLDVALGWIARRVSTCPVAERAEGRPSGYSFKSLFAHFLRMIVTSGTRGLRLVTLTGLLCGTLGVVLTFVLIGAALVSPAPVAGWTSTMVVLLVGIGLILVALGITAEYVGAAVNFSMGKPLFVISHDPITGPLADSPVLAAPPTAGAPELPRPGGASPARPVGVPAIPHEEHA